MRVNLLVYSLKTNIQIGAQESRRCREQSDRDGDGCCL